MSVAATNHRGSLLWRVGLWFASLLIAVGLFAGLFGALNSGNLSYWVQALPGVFGVTMIFAFPLACLCLPVVIALKNATKRQLWTLLIGGALIGPVCMALLSLILILIGGNAREIWYGDPLTGIGAPACMIFSFIVGTLTTLLYIFLLRIRARLTTASYSSAA